MATARYWRLTGIETFGYGADLALSDIGLYAGATRVDSGATRTSTVAPTGGSFTWAGADVRLPGFSITWDFGGAPQDVTSYTLGAVAADSFLYAAQFLSSSDGVTWAVIDAPVGLVFPGAGVTKTVSAFDPLAGGTYTLVMRMEDLTDASGTCRPVLIGGATISTAQKKFGSSSARFQGTGDTIDTLSRAPVLFEYEGFTVSAWFYPTSLPSNRGWIVYSDYVGGFVALGITSTGKAIFDGISVDITGTDNVTLNAWNHIEVTRTPSSPGTTRLFLNGVLQGSAADSAYYSSQYLYNRVIIGGATYGTASYQFLGFIDDVVIARGVVRDTANFTPPTYSLPWPEAQRTQAVPNSATAVIGAQAIGDTLALGYTAPAVSRDVNFGGLYRVQGTVKEKASPSNVPLRRRVQLYDHATSLMVREMWSDAATGAYTFSEVNGSLKYYVVAFDHTGGYRAVIADNLTPEAMP